MTDGTDFVERVLAIVARVAGPERTPPELGPETQLVDGGFWLDSVGLLEVIVALEDEFGIEFDADTDVSPETLRTVRRLAEVVEARHRA